MGDRWVFRCKMCGQCCFGLGGIPVDSKELSKIAKFLQLEEKELIEKFLKKGKRYFYIKERDGACIFFDKKEKKCKIHPVKPDICKAWPFLRGNMIDEISFNMAKTYCPGINPEITFEEFVEEGKKYLTKEGLLKPVKPFLILG